MNQLRLGVNIDHVATVRNARGGHHPDPLRAAMLIAEAGGDGVTAHLREDRRHIRDDDIARIKSECPLPLNFEMANTAEMVSIAIQTLPNACCLVPERREERTTEHGLDVVGHREALERTTARLKDNNIRVSLFVDPEPAQIQASADVGADIVEIHTGTFCEETGDAREAELAKIAAAATLAKSLGLEPHAGHGLDVETVGAIAAIPEFVELNIGHALIGEAIFSGFVPAVRQMRDLMNNARYG